VRRIHSGEQIVVAPVIPPIPIVFVFEARDAIERVTGFDDDPPALFDDDRPDLLVIDLGLALADDDFGRAVVANVDAVNAFFDEGHGDGRRVNFKVDRVVDGGVIRVNDLELAFVQAVNSEIGRAYGQRHLNHAGVELRETQIGVAVNADYVSSAELNFGSTVRAAVKLIAFVERLVKSRVEPVFFGIVGPLITDFAFDQADASDAKDGVVGQRQ